MGTGNESARAGCFASAGFTPAARIEIVSCPGPGGGTSYSSSVKVLGPVATQCSAMAETLRHLHSPGSGVLGAVPGPLAGRWWAGLAAAHPVEPRRSPMATIRMHASTRATPEQFVAALTDFGP